MSKHKNRNTSKEGFILMYRCQFCGMEVPQGELCSCEDDDEECEWDNNDDEFFFDDDDDEF